MAGVAAGPWSEPLRAAAADSDSGATAIAARASEALALLAEGAPAMDMGGLTAHLVAAGRQLMAGQPTMASLVHLLNAVLGAMHAADTLAAARARAAAEARAFPQRAAARQQAVAQLGAALVCQSCTVFTHSHSSAVAAALLRAAETGRAPRVICTESRPRREGLVLASRLQAAGIATSLVTDAAGFGALLEADLLMFGADSLAQDGVYNKVGTAALASVATVHGIPCYVLASTDKVWPARLGIAPRILDRPGTEVWPDAPAGVRVINRYFDITSWADVRGVVSDAAVLGSDDVFRLARDLDVWPEVLAMF